MLEGREENRQYVLTARTIECVGFQEYVIELVHTQMAESYTEALNIMYALMKAQPEWSFQLEYAE